MTLDYVETDLTHIFEYGQGYVTLSRVRKMQDLLLKGIDFKKIRCNPKVIRFYNEIFQLFNRMNIFIKCGGNKYEHYKQVLNIDASWDVYIFDPILCSDKRVVWINNSIVRFCYDTVAPESSSLYDLHSTHTRCRTFDVHTIDFSEFLESKKGSTIYCVMDIEGAEYTLLRHLIYQGTINNIHHLWVRWHYIADEDANELMDVLKDLIRVEEF